MLSDKQSLCRDTYGGSNIARYANGDDDDDDEEAQLQLQFLRELRFLREQLDDKESKNNLLQAKITALTDGLEQTTEQLERRMTLFSDAITRVERLEHQVSEAKKTLLTKEMQLHDLTQENNRMRKELEGKESERRHWEQQFLCANKQLSGSTRLNDKLKEANDEQKQEIKTWKAKMKRALRTVDELKQQIDAQCAKETELMQSVIDTKREDTQNEELWQAKNHKLQQQMRKLEQELSTLHAIIDQVQDNKRQAQEEQVAWKSDLVVQQLEKQKQVVHLREKLDKVTSALEKAQINEKLLQRENRRLREELLLSKSQCETEQRRVKQVVRGKDKEVAFIWQKYLDVMNTNASTDSSHRDRRRAEAQ